MKQSKSKLLLTLFVLIHVVTYGQNFQRQVTILDLSERNKETNNARLFSAEHMLIVAGLDYKVEQNLEAAFESKFVVSSSQLVAKTFNEEEKELLRQYVSQGGIFLAPKVLDEELFDLFGIESIKESKGNHLIKFDQSLNTPLFKYIDEPEEWTISLGRITIPEIFKTNSYVTNHAESLGYYENEETAFVKNDYEMGTCYAFGVSWKDVIARSQINRDYEAQRVSSNGFEPTQDVFCLLIRTIYNMHNPYGVWKHTSVSNSSSTIMITHDIDSSTGFDSLNMFTESESNMGIVADYNVTVRYFKDELMSDFYLKSPTVVPEILNQGHVLGSHSVGHFFDFGDEEIFPIGEKGNTQENYVPYNDGVLTFGGTVIGECEVSKKQLEKDFGQNIRIFRAGHLAYNKFLVNVLDDLGYSYNSSFAANTVLTNFPYRCKYDRSFSGKVSNIYEMAVSISDVFHSNPISESNYIMKAQTWVDVTNKIDANNGSTVLLIHPNRGYKLIGQEYYLNHIPKTVAVREMGAFGDYWKARESLNFESSVQNDSLVIRLKTSSKDIHEELSFIIKDGQHLDKIEIYDQEGERMEMEIAPWEEEDLIVYHSNILINTVEEETLKLDLKLYPNPVINHINLELDLKYGDDLYCEIYTSMGQRVYSTYEKTRSSGYKFIHMDLSSVELTRGVYFVKIDGGRNGRTVERFVKQ